MVVDHYKSWQGSSSLATLIGGDRRYNFDWLNQVYEKDEIGFGSKKRKRIVKSGGRGSGLIVQDQQLIVQNQDPTPTYSWRCKNEDDCYSIKNYAAGVTLNDTNIFCVLKGEIAFSIYGGPGGYKTRSIGGVPYARNETVLTNLIKGQFVIEGFVINPGATRGRTDSNRDQFCVTGKLGLITLINNSPFHLHVSNYVMGIPEAYTLAEEGTDRRVAAVQAQGTSDRSRDQRFLVQTVPIRSTSVSCNQQHITIALRIALRKAGENAILKGNDTTYVTEFLKQTAPEILKNMGFKLFRPFYDWGMAEALFLSFVHLIEQQGIDLSDKKDTIELPSPEWFNTVTNELKKLYSAQIHMRDTYDTDLNRSKTVNSVTSKNAEIMPISFLDTAPTTPNDKKKYLAQILYAISHLKTLTHNQAFELIMTCFIGKVLTEGPSGHWWNCNWKAY